MFKRKHTEDFDDRSQKKARFNVSEESVEDKLDELIVKIGEKNASSVEKNIDDLAEIFNIDILPENNRILDVFCECIVEFPQKICIYSTLIGLLNAKNYNFGGNVVEKLVLTLKNFLKNNNYEHARIIVRFLSDLVNTRVIAHAWLINLFENLVNVCNEDEIPQVRSDYFIYTVLSALPWVGKELYEKKENELDQILNTIEKYMRKRSQIKYHSALKVWHSDNPHPQEEYLTSLYNQILKLKSDKWVENHIYRPYINFDTVLCEGLQHNLAPVIPPSHEPSSVYPYPQVVFRLFDYTDCPERSVLPGPNSIERFLFEDILRWIINQNCFDRKDCAIALFNYSNLSIASKVPLEYIIVEVIFGELFALPESKYPEICYGSILLELCKFQPSTFPQVLAQAVELLFDRLDTMNGACVNRFASWFAYHLSNFQFYWKWDDWSVALKYEPLHLKTKFISETLQYCLRLSYHAKVLESVPERFHKLAPIAPKPNDKYGLAKDEEEDSEKMNQDDDENKSIKEYAAALTTSLKQKCSAEEALETLDEISDVSYNGDILKLKIEVFVSCLLNVSSKSMTHTFAYIAKYKDVLKKFNSNEENQLHILDTVFEVWSSHQQLLVILIDKLMKSEVLQCQAVANWVFSKANSEEFMKFYMWEILHATIKRSIRNTKRCAKELEEAKTNLKNMDSNTDKTDGDEISPFKALSETVEKLEEKLESSQTEQKNLFLVILHRFIMILTEHIQSCEAQNESFKNYWFFWTISRLQEVFFLYNRYIYKYNETYESLLFTDDLDSNILMIYKQFLCLHYEINKGCPRSCDGMNISVVHVESIVKNNPNASTYNYLWIFSPGYLPTIFLFETEPGTNLSINWPHFFDLSGDFIQFSNGSVRKSFALELTNLYLFDMKTKNSVYNITMNDLYWKANVSTKDNCSISVEFFNDNPDIGQFNFKISAFNHNGKSEDLPRLFFTESGNLINLSLEKITQINDIKNKTEKLQLSANFTVVTQGQPIKSFLKNYQTIDDEYTPGVFQRNIYQIDSKEDNETESSFMGWKPIAYYDHSKTTSKSLDVINPIIENITLISTSALNGYHWGKLYFATKLSNFRFGSEDDSDFELNNSTAIEFSFSCSLDNLDEKTFSTSMIVIMICLAIVLGLSMILFILNIIYRVFRQIFSRNSGNLLVNEEVINTSF